MPRERVRESTAGDIMNRVKTEYSATMNSNEYSETADRIISFISLMADSNCVSNFTLYYSKTIDAMQLSHGVLKSLPYTIH